MALAIGACHRGACHRGAPALALSAPGVARAGAVVYVANNLGNTIGTYDASTGAVINASLVTGLDAPEFLAVVDTPSSVPEPASLSLPAAGALGLAARRRRAA